MDLLPDDLKCKIFQELDAVHLCRLSAVSKSMGPLTDNPESWKIVHGSSKDEAKEIHLKNSADVLLAKVNVEMRKSELAQATTRALGAASEMRAVEDRTVNRYKETDFNSLFWNTYNTAVSDLVFAENQLDEAESNLEKADLEHWRVNGIAKVDSKKLRVPLRLRLKAEDALAQWKIADAATRKINPVCAGYLSLREKMGWKNMFEKERTTWWAARIAFHEIYKWEGNIPAEDVLSENYF